MSIQAAEIGISNELRVLQERLQQVHLGKAEVAEVNEEKITLRRRVDPGRLFGFETMTKMDDAHIKKMLKKVNSLDLIMALINAEKHTKEAVYRNLSEDSRVYIGEKVDSLEKGDVRYLMTTRSRNVISDAFLELLRV